MVTMPCAARRGRGKSQSVGHEVNACIVSTIALAKRYHGVVSATGVSIRSEVITLFLWELVC